MFLRGSLDPAEIEDGPGRLEQAVASGRPGQVATNQQDAIAELGMIAKLAASAFDASASCVAVMVDGAMAVAGRAGTGADRLEQAAILRHVAMTGHDVTIALDAAAEWRSIGGADRDGTPLFRFCAAAPLVASNGNRIGALCVFDDAPRARVSEAQREMMRQLAHLGAAILTRAARSERETGRSCDMFQAGPKPMWVYDPSSFAFLDVNEAAIAFYGYSREAFMAMTILDIRPPEERERCAAAVRDRSDLDDSAVWRHRKADGTDFDVITSGREVTFEGRKAVLVVALDRTEVQTLRATLGSTQLLLDTIIEALPTGLFLKDMQDDGTYIIYNTTLCDIVGRRAGEIVGRRDHDVFGSTEGAEFVNQDRSVMTSGRHLVVDEEPITRADGEVRWIRTVKRPLPTVDGGPPRYLLGISEDITDRRKTEDRLAHMAFHDVLTDLPNRIFFQQYLERALRDQKSSTIVLFYLDLDFFKTINDTYGHHVGDKLLKEVAARFRSCLCASDMVARLGGDEFAIVTKVYGDDNAADIAGRLLQCFDLPFDLGQCLTHIGASIGIAASPDRGQTADILMRHADIALYAAKAEGRGVAKIYTRDMSSHVEARHTISEDLRIALAEQQFELDYQPLYDLASNRITGFEALLRWRHPINGRVPPGDFIAIAEQTGLIVPIGDWVLREACRQAATWPAPIKVAVNLSAVQFKKAGLIVSITRALAESRLVPQRLELEITESILLAESGANIQVLHSLRALGLRIAIDDFGTGYSSLSYLRSFPFDKIKMDRSFVADVCENPGSLAIVRAVTGLGSSLSITTTAEGIETPEQFAKLKAEGFDELQGYLIGRPMPPEQARALAQSQTFPDCRVAVA